MPEPDDAPDTPVGNMQRMPAGQLGSGFPRWSELPTYLRKVPPRSCRDSENQGKATSE